jgi:Flp pilus assembly protein TadG
MTTRHSDTGAPPRGGCGRRVPLPRLAGDRRGASAIEFALIGAIFVVLLLNVVDFAMLIWSRMQVDYAAAAAAQAVYNICSPGSMPAKANCPNLDSVVQTAVRSTSLGGAVTNEPPVEEYYCTSGTNLRRVATYPETPPATCSGVEGSTPTSAPGNYVTVNVSYTFAPLFAGLSLVQEQPLTAMGMQRLR